MYRGTDEEHCLLLLLNPQDWTFKTNGLIVLLTPEERKCLMHACPPFADNPSPQERSQTWYWCSALACKSRSLSKISWRIFERGQTRERHGGRATATSMSLTLLHSIALKCLTCWHHIALRLCFSRLSHAWLASTFQLSYSRS